MLVLCGIHIATNKNSIALEWIQNRWIFGSRFCPHTYRWSRSSEECCTELYILAITPFLLEESICLPPWSMTFFIITFHYCLVITSISPLLHSLSLLCKQSSINSYHYSFFVNSIFWWNSILFDILSITCHTTFRFTLYNVALCISPYPFGLKIIKINTVQLEKQLSRG